MSTGLLNGYLKAASYIDEHLEDEGNTTDSDDEVPTAPDFSAEQCLFCNDHSQDLEQNVLHMEQVHSLTIPYRERLNVEVETFIWFLNLVIFGYHECIGCGASRRTAEAVQHHMLSKGHTRPTLDGDIAEFFTGLPSKPGAADVTGDSFLRLANGKLVSHRLQPPTLRRPRASRQGGRDALPEAGAPMVLTGTADSRQVSKKDQKAVTLESRLASLRSADRQVLARLPTSEQRSLLLLAKRQTDKARREERRSRSEVERKGNKTLMKHFKPDVPGPSNG